MHRLDSVRSHLAPGLAAEDGGGLKDEYGVMDSSGDTFIANDFQLDCGRSLKQAQARYKTWGKLNEAGDNGTRARRSGFNPPLRRAFS
jgi:hypothetical protein